MGQWEAAAVLCAGLPQVRPTGFTVIVTKID